MINYIIWVGFILLNFLNLIVVYKMMLNLGPKLHEIDELIKLIKFPTDHPNEFKSLIMYSLIFVLKPFMKKFFN